mmetsp:Transcript_75596/g.130876  ORF Transcript_75596/g.130876 Transcript_75596/m.130876 type:complete len:503 (+) Transcript_75596:102-1610(+)
MATLEVPEKDTEPEMMMTAAPSGRVYAAARKSRRASAITNLIDPEKEALLSKLHVEDTSFMKYQEILEEAQRCIGFGSKAGAFPEEWDAQLLVDAGRTSQGHRLVIFTPAFLKSILHDERELDRAFKYILLSMDSVAMKHKYVFVYCHSGMDWTNPDVASRLRLAYDILPRLYSKHLRRLYILHPTGGFKFFMWTSWAFMSTRLWSKMQYVNTIEDLCADLQPEDEKKRDELRRRFPQLVQREDSSWRGVPPPNTFGVPLKRLCDGFGVDFTDKTTGRWYPRLPPALVFLCEALERQAADEAFGSLFTSDAASTYSLVATIDAGEPLDPDTPLSTLWCGLKLFIDCLPSPLLGFQAFTDLGQKNLRIDDTKAQLDFIKQVIRELPMDAAYMALYLCSFLHTMCTNAAQRPAKTGKTVNLTKGIESNFPEAEAVHPALAAEVFAPGFLRPLEMSQESVKVVPIAIATLTTMIDSAEDPDLWIGSEAPTYDTNTGNASDSSEGF